MADGLDKRRRKEILDQLKAQRRAAARANLPLPDAQMQALFNMVDVELPRRGCDHSLRLVRRWLQDQGRPVERVVEWLQANGANCDCEVFNAEQAWRDAIHDVNW